MPLHLKMKLPERRLGAPGRLLHSHGDPRRSSASSVVPSFASVYEQYFDFVWSAARRLGAEDDSVDDCVQEVFIVIHAKLDTLENPEALRSWIYSIVRRTVSTHRRAQRARRPLTAAHEASRSMASREPTPLEQAETHDALNTVLALIQELDAPKREIFGLVELDELSVPEAAEALDIPINTAYSRLRAARREFDAAVARHQARSRGR